MATLIFLGTIITLIALVIKAIIQIIQHKSSVPAFGMIGIVILAYSLVWGIFYLKNNMEIVPFGTNIRFDDWAATITQFDEPKTLGDERQPTYPAGQFIVLHIKMSNFARGIAQKPSEPRVHIIDGDGHSWAYSVEGQLALEELTGKQIPVDQKLELHQSLETQLVFDVPKDAKDLKAIIEEGPFITKLLINEHKEVFLLQ